MNSDIEGWHNAINQRLSGRCGLSLYSLIKLLHIEVKPTALKIQVVSDRKLKRIERLCDRNLQSKLFSLWDKYNNSQKSAAQLLKACSYFNDMASGQ